MSFSEYQSRVAPALREELSRLYTPEEVSWILDELIAASSAPRKAKEGYLEGFEPSSASIYSAACLVSYADSVLDTSSEGVSPLQALKHLSSDLNLSSVFPSLHLLPFFPWDADRGFSVKDYFAVAEENGSWEDIKELADDFYLMFDFVVNHASIENPCVQQSLIGRHDPDASDEFKDFVIAYSEHDCPSQSQLSTLSRPRSAPILTPYYIEKTEEGTRAVLGLVANSEDIIGRGFVWTTFSRGLDEEGKEATRQVDLNYRNPKVFVFAAKLLSEYRKRGAKFIRLDAIGYLWKKLGSSSLHEPETHTLIHCLTLTLALSGSKLLSVSEVNEAQANTFQYLGTEERPEADIVYQFSHFPLAVHAVSVEDASYYNEWLKMLSPANGRQFTTVLGSHDGMGFKPLRGLLPEESIKNFAEFLIEERGGLPNYAILSGGEETIYEVCGTPWALINGTRPQSDYSPEELTLAIDRYFAVIALGLLPRGIPAFYFNGAFGFDNYHPSESLDRERNVNRDVNRERFELSRLQQMDLTKPRGSKEAIIFTRLKALLELRASLPEFQATASLAEVFSVENKPLVLCGLRASEESQLDLISVVNVSAEEQLVDSHPFVSEECQDLISGVVCRGPLSMKPYQVSWLCLKNKNS